MPYISPEIVAEAKRMDLLTYLRTYDPNELVHVSGGEYTTKTHDSLRISDNGLWHWCSQGVGGKTALEYLIQVKELSFIGAVETITGRAAEVPPVFSPKADKNPKTLILPTRTESNCQAVKYLKNRGIDQRVISHCIASNRFYEGVYRSESGRVFRQCVFVGFDPQGKERYAAVRGIGTDFKGEATGSDKRYSFCMTAESPCDTVHVYESAIDAMSHATLMQMYNTCFKDRHLLSLAGVYAPKTERLPLALSQFLSDHTEVTNVHLHLDRDEPGRVATKAIMMALEKKYDVLDSPPPRGKDVNDWLCHHEPRAKKARERER